MDNKKSLVPTQKLDTVSPATRLLDKRRKMYENQEAFIAKKKHFTQQEFEFQTREAELREEDHKLQQSLIQYATFLDNNAKVMRNCDQNIAKLREENEQRAREIERKRKQYDILQSKKKRIEQQKASVEKYQQFLEDVKSTNDDYSEVVEICDRYLTLSSARDSLCEGKIELDRRLEEKKAEVSNFERVMDAKVMTLGNEIATLTVDCDRVDAEKSALQNDEEETSAKKWEQIAELSQVIFAIEMIENLCSKKTETHVTHLPYSKYDVKQESFERFPQCEGVALIQLEHIGNYLQGFKKILEGFDPSKVKSVVARGANTNTIQEDSDEDD